MISPTMTHPRDYITIISSIHRVLRSNTRILVFAILLAIVIQTGHAMNNAGGKPLSPSVRKKLTKPMMWWIPIRRHALNVLDRTLAIQRDEFFSCPYGWGTYYDTDSNTKRRMPFMVNTISKILDGEAIPARRFIEDLKKEVEAILATVTENGFWNALTNDCLNSTFEILCWVDDFTMLDVGDLKKNVHVLRRVSKRLNNHIKLYECLNNFHISYSEPTTNEVNAIKLVADIQKSGELNEDHGFIPTMQKAFTKSREAIRKAHIGNVKATSTEVVEITLWICTVKWFEQIILRLKDHAEDREQLYATISQMQPLLCAVRELER